MLYLNGNYCVHDHILLRRFLRVRHLERNIEFITYIDISRSQNHASNALVNFVLNWDIIYINIYTYTYIHIDIYIYIYIYISPIQNMWYKFIRKIGFKRDSKNAHNTSHMIDHSRGHPHEHPCNKELHSPHSETTEARGMAHPLRVTTCALASPWLVRVVPSFWPLEYIGWNMKMLWICDVWILSGELKAKVPLVNA